MRFARWGIRAGLAVLGAVATATCDLSDILTEPGVEDVVVSFSTEDSTVVLGSTVAVPVAVTLNGEPFAEARLRVSSSDTTVVGVSTAGDSLIARKRGRAMVTVELVSSALPDSAPGVARTFRVVADAVALDSSSVTFLSLRDTVRLEATATDAAGAEVSGATVTWQSSDASVVGVNSSGRLLASGVGTAQVRAIVDFDTARAGVLVRNDPVAIHLSPDEASLTSVGDELVLSVAVLNRRSDTIPAAPVNARSTDTLVVRLSPSRDRAISVSTGTARLIASTAGAGGAPLADTTVVTVTDAPAELRIVPDLLTLRSIGDVDTPAVVIKNARGASLPRGAVSWTSDEPEIARVTPIGQVQARDTGTTTVRATSGSLEDSVLVLVTNDPASLRIIGRDVDTLTALGQSLTYRVEVKNARGNVINNFPVVWRSTNLSVVDTVTPEGVVTAAGFGTARLIAEARAAADTVTVVVHNLTRLFVDNSVVANPRVGTFSRPYARIQDAINATDANDTIVVRRGTGSYAESIELTRRLVILGDSLAFLSASRNPNALPLLAHDTGTAGIRIQTTAPQTFRYLAIRHTLDGAAIDADGSDVTLEYVYVNPSGSVSSRIGRGISIMNSPSGTSVRNVVVDSVRAYGIRLENVSNATIRAVQVRGVDSLGAEAGAGVAVLGGSGTRLANTLVRLAQVGVLVTSGATAMRMESTVVYRNAWGARLDGGSFSNIQALDVFDNDSVGVLNPVAGQVIVNLGWWGDSLGPRRGSEPAAAGDTAIGDVSFTPLRSTPLVPGTTFATLRPLRGNGQGTATNSTLPIPFTVRAISADGFPVAGVSVTFTVTAGGGNFVGQSSVTVATNSSGLARATFTAGPAAGVHTVSTSTASSGGPSFFANVF